jgi:hypothetical protein
VADIEVTPIVTGATVTTRTCDNCAALMVSLTVGGLHEDGVAQLPPILCCPDCFDPKQVVAEWREQVRRQG